MSKSICDGKYFISSLHNDSIGLPIQLPDLPETIEANGLTLHRKATFHVTLFPVGKLIEKHNIKIPGFRGRAIDDFCEFVETNPISIINYKEEFRFVAENERRTVVAMCDVSNLNKFYDLVNDKYGLHLGHPPTHVTLYSLQPDAGIYLIDQKEIEKMTKLIENPGIVVEKLRN